MQQGSQQGFAKRLREGEVYRRGKGGSKCKGVAALPPPSLYKDPRGGAGPRRGDLLGGGAAAKGGDLPPKASGGAPTLGFPTLGAGGPKGGGAHQPTRGWFSSHFSPRGPPG